MRGVAWKFRDDVNTDEIIPARYLNTSDPKELALHCMEDIDPNFMEKMSPGDIIVAGRNFGCGSSREHAPVAIQAAGISCVIAESFARIFYRNAVNIGLPIMESKEGAERIREGDVIRVEPEEGKIINETTGEEYQVASFPPFMQEIIGQGGLINYVRARVQESR